MNKKVQLTAITICILSLLFASCKPALAPKDSPEPPGEVFESEPQTTSELPIFRVVQRAPSMDAIQRLGQALGIPNLAPMENRSVFFTETDLYLNLPLDPPEEGEPDEDGFPTIQQALDLDALQAIQVLPDDQALNQAQTALQQAGLDAFGDTPLMVATTRIEHATIELVEVGGAPFLNKPLNTEVVYDFTLNDLPFIGAGAKVKLAFDEHGQATLVQYAMPRLEQAGTAPVFPASQMEALCLEAYLGGDEQGGGWQVRGNLVYFAPDPDLASVTMIYPHFQCSLLRTVEVDGRTQTYAVPTFFIPAVVGRPEVSVTLSVEGERVIARANVQGGTPPYRFSWFSSSTDLGYDLSNGGPEIDYRIEPAWPIDIEEISVEVTDANGLKTSGKKSTPIAVAGKLYSWDEQSELLSFYFGMSPKNTVIGNLPPTPGMALSLYEFYMALKNNYHAQFGVIGHRRNRERDFRDVTFSLPLSNPTSPPGEDNLFVDNVDMAVGCYYGDPNGILFGINEDSPVFTYEAGKFGDRDLEWLVLFAPYTLAPGGVYGGQQYRHDRWQKVFYGLHQILGYSSSFYSNPKTSHYFASMMLGGFTPRSSFPGGEYPIYYSWWMANSLSQPSKILDAYSGTMQPVKYSVMAPVGVLGGGTRKYTNLIDHLTLHGWLTQDIQPSDILYFATLTSSP